jgi:hypothetical protein
MRVIGPADSAQKRGKSAKICEFSEKFFSSFFTQLGITFETKKFCGASEIFSSQFQTTKFFIVEKTANFSRQELKSQFSY